MLSCRRRPGVRRHGHASRDTTQEGPRGDQPQPGRLRQVPRTVVGVHLPPRVRQADAELRDPRQGRRIPRTGTSPTSSRTGGRPSSVLFDRAEADERVRKDLLKFKASCERYLELEEQTGRRLDLAPQYPRISAERLAEEERRRLGLGNEPIRDVLNLCEANGLRIVRQTLPEESRIAGIFVFDEERKAAFALIDANEPPGFQTLVAAHLYGHYLMDRDDSPIVDDPDVVVEEYVSLYPPREQFAQTFASRFLVPPDKLRELVEKDFRSKSLSFDDVLFLKRYFGVSTRAMLRTLRGRGILPEAKFEDYFKRNPEDREQEVFGGLAGQEERRTRTLFRKSRTIPSDRYRLIAAEAAAMDKARAEHPPAPPKTGDTDE
ncbi:MAG: ImmA/IrrE family metallo-endopeptidase [Candidatus Moduliflexus flocculans]|nr:ImmA/IrrE family metallo-endopeptidase [Candidatus Moduliflexus flocculans]